MCSMGDHVTARVRRARRRTQEEGDAEAATPLTVVAAGSKADPNQWSKVEAGDGAWSTPEFVTTLPGRPDFDHILEELTSRAARSDCPTTGVYMSGPRAMVEALEQKVLVQQVSRDVTVRNVPSLTRHVPTHVDAAAEKGSYARQAAPGQHAPPLAARPLLQAPGVQEGPTDEQGGGGRRGEGGPALGGCALRQVRRTQYVL